MATLNRTVLFALVVAGCVDPPMTPPDLRLERQPLALETDSVSGEPFLWESDGEVLLSWLDKADGKATLRFAQLEDRRSGWSVPRTIASGDNWFVNWADVPSIARRGEMLWSHWLEYNGEGTYTYGIRISASSDNGRSWSAPVWLHDDRAEAEHGFVAMAAHQDAVHAVWLDGRKYAEGISEMTVRSRALRASASDSGGGAVLSPEVVLDDRSCDCCPNAIAAQPGEALIMAYRNRTADEVRDIYVMRYEGGAWGMPRPVYEDGWQIDACPVNGPSLAADGKNVALVWFTAAQNNPRVQIAFSTDAGSSFSDPVVLAEGDTIGRVDVVLMDDGSAVATWISTSDAHAGVVARRAYADGRMSKPVLLVEASTSRSSGYPRLVRQGTSLILAWTETAPVRTVRTARFETAG